MVSDFGGLPEHRQGAGSMALVGKYAVTGGYGQPVVSLVLPGGDTFLGAIICDDEDGGE